MRTPSFDDDDAAFDRLDADRRRFQLKRLIAEAEDAVEYASWRAGLELEIEIRHGVTFDPDNPRNLAEPDAPIFAHSADDWLEFLRDHGLN